MWRDLRLLLRLRARTVWNGVRTAPAAHRLIGALLSAGSLVLFVVILFAFAGFLLATRAQAGTVVTNALIAQAVFYLFLFLLAGSIPFVSGVLFAPGDLTLLAASPIRPAAVVCARLLDAVIVSSGQFLVIGTPLLLASAWVLFGASFVGWLMFVVVLLLFLALPPLLTAALLLLLARVVGLRRIRAAVAIASAVLSVALCLLTVAELSQRASGTISLVTATQPRDTFATADYLPSTWVTKALIGLGTTAPQQALLPAGQLLALTLLAAAVAIGTGGGILLGESLLEGDSSLHGSGGSRLDTVLRGFPISPAVRALITKDLRYIARDLTLLSQMGIPFILYFVPFVIGIQTHSAGHDAADLLSYLSLGIIGMIVYMVTSILSLSSIGLEGEAFWLVLTAPVSSGSLVRAKWLMASGASILPTLPLLLVSAAVYRLGAAQTFLAVFLLVTGALALCGFGVGLSGLFPRFVYENPAHRASLTALIWGFVGATTYLIIAGGIVGLTLWFAPQWPERASLLIAGGLGIFFLLSLGVCLFPLGIASARLDGYAWEL